MEMESEDGEKISVGTDSSTEIGRNHQGLKFRRPSSSYSSSSDRTISRRHLSLQLSEAYEPTCHELIVSFEVIGKNPILVCSGGEKRVYHKSDKGELRAGDRFSLSLKNPSFWVLNRRGGGDKAVAEEMEGEKGVWNAVARRERRTLERRREKECRAQLEVNGGTEDEEAGSGQMNFKLDASDFSKRRAELGANGGKVDEEEAINKELEFNLEALDISRVDPVKEFGFLVRTHEFDHYPKRKVCSPKNWNWFLEDPRGSTDNDDDDDAEPSNGGTSLKRKIRSRTKKNSEDLEDEEWTGESKEEKENIGKAGRVGQSKYSTRSKNPKRLRRDDLAGKSDPARSRDFKHRNDEDDKEDETLGGFIVDEDEEEETEEDEMEEEDEKDEFDEDDDDDDDD